MGKVALAIVPKGDATLARRVCPNAMVLETHHPDIEGAELVLVSREVLRAALNIPTDAFVALIPGSKTREVNEEVLATVRDAKLKNVVVLFLTHPGEQGTPSSVYEGYGVRVVPAGTMIAGQKSSADLLLPAADVFCNIASTSADRAGCLRIPTLWFQTPKVRAMLKKNSGNETPEECLGEKPVAVAIESADGLQTVVVGLRNKPEWIDELRERQEAHYPLPTPTKGTAVKAMASAILAIVK